MKDSTKAITAALGYKIINIELKYKVLEELLIEKEILTTKEIEEKYKQVFARDAENLNEELTELSSKLLKKKIE